MFGTPPWFLANFSCYGSGLDAAAPGVGLISTVPVSGDPNGGYGVMDGTSQASPLACGTLAALLSADPTYRGMAATSARSALARQMLISSLKSFGLGVQYEAGGVPQLP
jgi:subtilisin